MIDPRSSVRDKSDEEAIEWLVECDAGLSSRQMCQLSAWLEERPENRAAFERMNRLSERLSVLKSLATDEVDEDVVSRWLWRRRLRQYSAPFAAAAAIAAIAIALWVSVPATYETEYQTSVGQQEVLTLPDQSRLTLNTDTRITVRFDDTKRWVHLERGEAHFEIASDAKRPFSVRAGGGTVTAVGTVFNVYVRHDEVVEVTVSEGAVEVLPTIDPPPGETADPPESDVVAAPEVLAAGQTLEYLDEIESVSTVAPEELERQQAWQEGRLEFTDQPLGDIVEELNRYFPVKFSIVDAEVAARRLSIYMRTENVEYFIWAVQSTHGVGIRRTTPQHIQIVATP